MIDDIPQPGGKEAGRNYLLDHARAIAALAVCAGHVRAIVLVDFDQSVCKNVLAKSFYLLTGLGHQAVVVFFVISGFLVGGSVLKKGLHLNFLEYILARLTRLWVVLVPALCFTFLIDICLEQLYPEALSGRYYPSWNSGPSQNHSLAFSTFIGNIVFVQTFLVPVWGSNSPLWSLFNEFWYYVSFPLIVMAFQSFGSKKWWRLAILTFTLFGLLLTLPKTIWHGFAIWLFGTAAWWIRDQGWNMTSSKRRFAFASATTFFFASLIFSRSPVSSRLLVDCDLLIGISFAIVVLVHSTNSQLVPDLLLRPLVAISGFSYTLYLFHFPIVMAIGAIAFRENQLQLSTCALAIFLSINVAIVLLSMLFWSFFESRTTMVRRSVRKLFATSVDSSSLSSS